MFRMRSYAVETVNGVERPDFGPNYNSLNQKTIIEDEIAEELERITDIIDRNSEYTITNKVWINTNWWALIEDLQKLYSDLIDQLVRKPNRAVHVNYVFDIIQMLKMIRNWCEENDLSRESLEQNKINRQDIFLVLV